MFVRSFFEPASLMAGSVLLSLVVIVSDVQAEPEMTDQTISDKIDNELLFDRGVTSSKIDVDTTNGIVTLSGEVNNILARERSARIAETVKGVRAVVNRIAVKPSKYRSDANIEKDIEAALLDDPATESFEVVVNAQDGEVTLTGTVDSYRERDLAKTVAKGVRGVTAVDDRIDVEYEAERPDYEIKREIEQALRWNLYVDDELIDLAVSDGKVKLSGTVGSAAEKRFCRMDAWVAGVESVDASDLSVEQWARDDKLRGDKYVVKTDEELVKAVNAAMLYDPRVMSFNVDVEVVGSGVTLRGTVDNLKAKRAAEQNAKNTVGVLYVNNRLKVRVDNPPSDADIADDILAAFARDPYVERFEVTITVIDGTAHLYGSVDSYLEKNRADELASRVRGVLDIENHLTVDYQPPYIFDPYVDEDYVESDELIEYDRRAPYQSDVQVKDAIEDELWWSPFVDADEVHVMVDDGIATLTGTVDSWSERRAATENAYEGGATLVDNDLAVEN